MRRFSLAVTVTLGAFCLMCCSADEAEPRDDEGFILDMSDLEVGVGDISVDLFGDEPEPGDAGSDNGTDVEADGRPRLPDLEEEPFASDTEREGEDDATIEQFPPGEWGPYFVGTRSFTWLDMSRWRLITTRVWYPAEALPAGPPRVPALRIEK